MYVEGLDTIPLDGDDQGSDSSDCKTSGDSSSGSESEVKCFFCFILHFFPALLSFKR